MNGHCVVVNKSNLIIIYFFKNQRRRRARFLFVAVKAEDDRNTPGERLATNGDLLEDVMLLLLLPLTAAPTAVAAVYTFV